MLPKFGNNTLHHNDILLNKFQGLFVVCKYKTVVFTHYTPLNTDSLYKSCSPQFAFSSPPLQLKSPHF